MGPKQGDPDFVIKSSLENNGARNREGEQASEIYIVIQRINQI
jgi:hypothetical protein